MPLMVMWVISPVVLIPLMIHFMNKSKRMEELLKKLHGAGRIDNNEYFQAVKKMPPMQQGQTPPYPPQGMGQPYPPQQGFMRGQPVNAPQNAAMQNAAMQNAAMQNMRPQPFPSGQNTPSVQQGAAPVPPVQPIPQGMPSGNMNAMPNTVYRPTPPKPQKTVSSSSVMLTVGVILVSIAGLIFATAVWASMSGAGRTGTIAFAAIFFFIISAFSYKKLKLENSSNAFYSLGAAFTLITYLTAGYYELFGSAFSFEGKHMWGFVSGGLCIVTALAALGHRLYKKKYLAVISLSGGFAAFMALSLDISGSDKRVFSMMSALALCACLLIVIYIKGKPEWAADTLRVCAGLAFIGAVNAPFFRYFGDWKGADIVTVIAFFGIISFYAFKRSSKPMLCAHSIYMAAVALSSVYQLCKVSENEDKAIYILFFAFLALGLIYRGFEALRTPVSDNAFSIVMAVTLIVMADMSDTSLMPILCAAAMIGFALIFALDRRPYSKVYGALMPLLLVYIAGCIDSYLSVTGDIDTAGYTLIFTSIVLSLIAGALVLLGKKQLKFELKYIRGSFIVFTALCSLFIASSADRDGTVQLIIGLLAAMAAFAAVYVSKLEPLSVLPAVRTAALMSASCDSLASDGLYAGKLIGALAAFAVFMILSRLCFAQRVFERRGLIFRADSFAFGAGAAVIRLFDISTSYILISESMRSALDYDDPKPIEYCVPLLAWVCLTALLFLLIRDKNGKSFNTLSAIGASVGAVGVAARLITFIEQFINAKENIGELVAAVIVFVCLCILSRVIFSETLFVKGQNVVFPDIFAAASAAALYRLYMVSQSGYSSAQSGYEQTLYQTEIFIFWLAAGIFAFILIRKKSSSKANIVLKLISSGAFLTAFIERPFLVSDMQTIEMKVTVIAIAIFGFAAKFILRNNEKLAENFATAVHVFAMILLIGDALAHQSLINTLIVMSTAAGVMVVSFIIKRKRWFLISAVMLVGLTLYICKDFLASISWWVYLLVIGITLIAIAVSNEYLKNKNEQSGMSEEKKKGRLFEEWKW